MDDKTYINCNYIVCAVSGFVTIAAGWGAFVLLLRIRYPFLAAGSDNLENFILQPFGQWLQNKNPCVYIASYIFSSALCGSLWSCVGLAVSAFYPDRKVALASPFIINILLYNVAYISTGPWHSPSDVAKYISQANDAMTFLCMAGYFVLLHVVVHRIFRFKMRWRFIHA